MAVEVGAAYVSILPSMSKFTPAMSKEMGRASATAQAQGQRVSSRFSDGFKSKLKIGAAIGGAMAVAAGGKFLKESIKEASDLGESINAVNVTFGKNAKGIKDLGETAANSLGLSNAEFNGLAVQFSAFSKTIAGRGGDVVGVMDDLTTRGADFASVMNLDVDEAMRLFQSGLAGETEPLRKFGIDLSAAAVESHAVATGIADAGEKMTEQQKVQARYSLLMKQTSKTQGDFANTSDSLANSQRILGANWDDIQAKVGAKLVPALERLTGWVLDKLLPGLEKFSGWIKQEVVPQLKSMGSWVSDNRDYLIAAGSAILGALAALKAFMFIKNVIVAIKAFNLVLRANPLGIVITLLGALAVGLVYAYKKSETFRRIVDAAWAGVKKVISFAWNNVIKPAFKAMWWYIENVLIPVYKFLWERVVKPVFGWIGDKIKGVWENVIRPAFQSLRGWVGKNGTLATAFTGAVNKIGAIWDGLKALAAKPVNFLIDTVYNNGLRKMLNLIPGVNLGRANTVNWGSTPTPAGTSGGLQEFASGGRVWGAGTETSDSIPALLSKNEFVIRAAQAKKHYALLEAINRGTDFRYAKGGRVWPVPGRSTGTYPGHDGVDINRGSGWDDYGDPIWAAASGQVSYVGTGRGYGLATFIRGPYGELVYGHMSQAMARAGQSVLAGQRIGSVGNTGNSSAPHLHFGFPGGTTSSALAFLAGADVSGGKSGGGGIFGAVKEVLSTARDVWQNVKNMATSGWGGMLKDAMFSVLGKVKDWVNGKIPGPGPIPGGIFDSGGVLEPGHYAFNASRKPEAVFNHRQFEAFAEAGRREVVINVHESTDAHATAREVARQFAWAGRG